MPQKKLKAWMSELLEVENSNYKFQAYELWEVNINKTSGCVK